MRETKKWAPRGSNTQFPTKNVPKYWYFIPPGAPNFHAIDIEEITSGFILKVFFVATMCYLIAQTGKSLTWYQNLGSFFVKIWEFDDLECPQMRLPLSLLQSVSKRKLQHSSSMLIEVKCITNLPKTGLY